ncbi:MAG: penicillin acylase family protein [Bacteroidetes bacterium]|nr:penicillin acylase family protein [Bacteroidota bacterium]
MFQFLRNFAGVLISLTVIAASFTAFSLFIATRSEVSPNTTVYSTIKDTIRVYRNQFSVPHIIAGSEADGYFALGYVHAQDRLWQMDIARRAGQGRLAEIFGKEALETDKFLRALDLEVISQKVWKTSSKTSRFIMEQYSNGVNAFINDHKIGLPFEFGALGYAPDQWQPTDCILIGRMMAFEMSIGFWSDIAFGEIADKLGNTRAAELVPSYPNSGPFVIPSDKKSIPAQAPKSASQAAVLQTLRNHDVLNSTAELLTSLRKFMGMNGSGVGSNSWVMKTTSSGSGSTILANDPHLSLSLPARWYQAHLTTPSMNITGLTIAGIPLFIVGRNDNIAWGITNMMADDCDYYVEKVDSNPNYYFNEDGKRVKFKYRRDTIHVKGDESLIYDIRFTKRSAIISDVHAFNSDKILDMSNSHSDNFLQKYALSFSWTAQQPSDEILAMYRINKASNWQEFQQGINLWCVPALNFSFTDRRGNIGMAPAGLIPIHGKGNTNIPNPGWLPEFTWQGFHTSSELPRSYNPQRRYLMSANNKTAESLPFFISSLWEPSSRAERMDETLQEFDEYSVRDAQFMQMDVTSPFARTLLKRTLPVIESKQKYLSQTEREAFTMLQKWDGIISGRSPQPAIYSGFLTNLLRQTFEDELGERLYREYVFVANLPTRKILELLSADSSSAWFDNVKTKEIEDKNEIIFRSFVLAVRSLQDHYKNNDIHSWKYGDIHQITLNHLFSANPYMKQIVTNGPFASGGDNTTLNNGEYHFYQPKEQVLGASMRFIADMKDTVVYSVLPGGNSGEPLSAHYSDQVQLWLNGGYIRIPINRLPDPSFTKFTTIIPKVQEK